MCIVKYSIYSGGSKISIFSVSPQSCSLFSASFHTFCLTARAYLNTKKKDCFAVYSRSILMYSFLEGCQQSGVKSNHVTRLLVSAIVSHPTCKGNPNSGIQVVFGCRISNVIKSRLYNQQSWALKFKIQLKESGIPLTIGIQNPSAT